MYLFDCSYFCVELTDYSFIYVLIMWCLYCDYFHIHMELYFD